MAHPGSGGPKPNKHWKRWSRYNYSFQMFTWNKKQVAKVSSFKILSIKSKSDTQAVFPIGISIVLRIENSQTKSAKPNLKTSFLPSLRHFRPRGASFEYQRQWSCRISIQRLLLLLLLQPSSMAMVTAAAVVGLQWRHQTSTNRQECM